MVYVGRECMVYAGRELEVHMRDSYRVGGWGGDK